MTDQTHAERLAGLVPGFKPRAQALLETMARLGASEPWRPVVIYGHRSPAKQEDLYHQGRERHVVREGDRLVTRWRPGGPGVIVTKARAWESPHVFGLAVDIALVSDIEGVWLPAEHSAWVVLECEANKLGLETGRTWKFVDCAHVQEPEWRILAGDQIEVVRRKYA